MFGYLRAQLPDSENAAFADNALAAIDDDGKDGLPGNVLDGGTLNEETMAKRAKALETKMQFIQDVAPTTPSKSYDLFFSPRAMEPAAVQFSFDILSFDPTDNALAWVHLESLTGSGISY